MTKPSTPTTTRGFKKPKDMRKFLPLEAGDRLLKKTCPACEGKFIIGDEVTLVPLGPGPSPEARYRARQRRPYNAVALPVHWGCATGGDSDPADAAEA